MWPQEGRERAGQEALVLLSNQRKWGPISVDHIPFSQRYPFYKSKHWSPSYNEITPQNVVHVKAHTHFMVK